MRTSGSTPLLALDARNFAATYNAVLRLGDAEKCRDNPLFVEDFFADPPRRWEARFDNVYPSVIYDKDEGVFKCWYRSFIVDEASNKTPLEQRPGSQYVGDKREEGLCYATSKDGLNWKKPALGLIEFEGSRANNLVMRRATHGIHAGGVLKDSDDPDPARRYKFTHRNPRARRMASCFSPDGIQWSQPVLWPQHDAVGDTHNNAIWSPELGKYVAITRGWSEGPYRGVRTALRSESSDFVKWSAPVEIMRGIDEHDQIYSMPIVRYAGLYIGLPASFHKGDDAAANWDRVDTELAFSADTVSWQRVCPGQALIPARAGQLSRWRIRLRLHLRGGSLGARRQNPDLLWRQQRLAQQLARKFAESGDDGHRPLRRLRPTRHDAEGLAYDREPAANGGQYHDQCRNQ